MTLSARFIASAPNDFSQGHVTRLVKSSVSIELTNTDRWKPTRNRHCGMVSSVVISTKQWGSRALPRDIRQRLLKDLYWGSLDLTVTNVPPLRLGNDAPRHKTMTPQRLVPGVAGSHCNKRSTTETRQRCSQTQDNDPSKTCTGGRWISL